MSSLLKQLAFHDLLLLSVLWCFNLGSVKLNDNLTQKDIFRNDCWYRMCHSYYLWHDYAHLHFYFICYKKIYICKTIKTLQAINITLRPRAVIKTLSCSPTQYDWYDESLLDFMVTWILGEVLVIRCPNTGWVLCGHGCSFVGWDFCGYMPRVLTEDPINWVSGCVTCLPV